MVNILDGVAREGVIQAEFISVAHIQVLGRHIFTHSSALRQEENSCRSEW